MPSPTPGEFPGDTQCCPRHPLLQGRPSPWRRSHSLPTDLWGCVSAEMAETPLQGCRNPTVRVHPKSTATQPCSQTPPSPGPCPEIPAQLWVPSLREPPVYANIITWSQKDEAGHWGHPFWLPQHLLSCFPPALLLRWMHKSQAVGITFYCPCTCFAFSRNLPGCQSRTVAGSLFPGKLNTYILHKEIRGLALKLEYTSLQCCRRPGNILAVNYDTVIQALSNSGA